MTNYDKKIDELVDNLGCSIAEAVQILKDDEVIDKGKERTAFDLSPEEEKKALKYANTTTKKKPVYKFDKRPDRKENITKKSIISELCKVLTDLGYENVSPINDQKFIYFMCNNDIYTLNLTQAGKKTYEKTLQIIKEHQENK